MLGNGLWLVKTSNSLLELRDHMKPWKPEFQNPNNPKTNDGWFIFKDITLEEYETRWMRHDDFLIPYWDDSGRFNHEHPSWKTKSWNHLMTWEQYETLLCSGIVF